MPKKKINYINLTQPKFIDHPKLNLFYCVIGKCTEDDSTPFLNISSGFYNQDGTPEFRKGFGIKIICIDEVFKRMKETLKELEELNPKK